jgi:diguanylate cyclase
MVKPRPVTKKTETAAVTQSVTALARLLDAAPVGMLVATATGALIYSNRAFSSLLDHPPVAEKPANLIDLVARDEEIPLRLQFERLVRGECETYHGEHRFCHEDGQPLWVMVAASRLPGTGKEKDLVILQLTSIELQKKAEEALAYSESRWNFALESARQGVWDHDIRRDTMFYSRMWRRMRAIPPEEHVDGDQALWLARIHPDDRAHVIANVDRQDKGDESLEALQYRELTRDGRYIWILSRGRPVEWDEEGNPVRTIGTDTDITY